MKNFNIRYECLDARDDYRAQLKKGDSQAFIGSCDKADDDDDDDDDDDGNDDPKAPSAIEFDDTPIDLLSIGPRHSKRLKEMEMINQVLSSMGWTEPTQVDWQVPGFWPEKIFPGNGWEKEVEKQKEAILEKKNEHNKANPSSHGSLMQTPIKHIPDVVKVIDKSYLEKKFHIDGVSHDVNDSIKKLSLNEEQERAFRIIANHSISQNPEQLCMYLGGMGGTGKSQVIKALSTFFDARNESHKFIIVAPTGTAAALLGGSTYHSMFGINERMSSNKIGHIKAKLNGVAYVFLDEVSMLSARDLYRINSQLAKVFGVAEIPFGGLNMVFSGDFSQLPPAVGGEHVSLYSRSIGAFATDKKSQEEAIGKALWHQITTVVILRKNMRQKKQGPEDTKLRTALENMRYKACTGEDINFLRTLISSSLPGRPSICSDDFRNVSIITGTNLQKDEINRVGALRFAQETNQRLVDFYSEDSSRVSSTETDNSTGIKRISEITEEIQKALWDQQPSTTDKHITGKLSLCLGLPVMIRYNYATELCMTRGQEGYIYGWQLKTGSRGQAMLDTLFVKLKNPPTNVQINGLPENVVPVYPTTNNIRATLPNDECYQISREQVEVLVNFAMTDFASQGKTRPFNVADLNNLSNHQAYYTALSRSATACGTLILQGFDVRKMTGGCSGALRQEFRELELLDEITLCRYMGKLPVTVYGKTRNTVIAGFREWKGIQYVPKSVHPAIRWSKQDPLVESKVYDLSKLNSTHTVAVANPPAQQHVPDSKKRRRSSGVIEVHWTASDKPTKKKMHFQAGNEPVPYNINNNTHYPVPMGMKWSQNSCAYDVIFTILFNIWCHDKSKWETIFNHLGNDFSILLINEFFKYDENKISLETARDSVRNELARFSQYMRFGSYTSIEHVCEAMFTTSNVIYQTHYHCPNNHRKIHSEFYTTYMSKGLAPFRSTSEWMRTNSQQGTNCCELCFQPVNIETIFVVPPPLLVLEFSSSTTDIDHSLELTHLGELHRYNIAGIIYYRDHHFISHIITPDKQVWFYDGLNNGGQMLYSGSLETHRPLLTTSRGGSASAAIYIPA